MTRRSTLLTGIKPTGVPHIGNYLGAIAPALQRANQFENVFFFIADYHALNSIKNPDELHRLTLSVAATWLAAGLDPNKIHLYRQSDIPEIFELQALLNNITPKGWMNKMHAYKAQVDINTEQNRPKDSGINMGLYIYPLLMASDILIFNSDAVPVGSDQVQHLEIARDIAKRFNNDYQKDVFTLPEFILEKGIEELPGLDGRKMSKSYANTIPLFSSEQQWSEAVKKIVTDNQEHTPESFQNTVFYKIFSAIADQKTTGVLVNDFVGGKIGWKDAKERLVEQLVQEFSQKTEHYNQLIANPAEINKILHQTAKDIRPIAQKTLQQAKAAVGIR